MELLSTSALMRFYNTQTTDSGKNHGNISRDAMIIICFFIKLPGLASFGVHGSRKASTPTTF